MTTGTIRVPGVGPVTGRIMIVGEAPGREEEVQKTPFIGASGQLLRERLMAIGLRPNDIWFTNVCKYRPPGNEIKAFFDKRGIPNDLILAGMLELREEIEAFNPNVIIALGNTPLWALTRVTKWKGPKNGYTGIGDWRGSIIEGHRAIAPGRKIVAAYHPAAILRKYSFLQTFELDLRRAAEQSLYPEIRRPVKDLVIDPQGADRVAARDWLLSGSGLLTFDIEQLGSNLLCIGMTTSKDKSVVIRTRTASDIAFCRDILLSGRGLCAQNGMFDCAMLEYWHRMPGLIKALKHDTMLAAHAAYIELPKDLGFLCSIYTEQPCYWTDVDWKAIKKELAGGTTRTVDSIDFQTYNGIDAWVTHDVMEQQCADELQDPAIKKVFDFEMGLLEPLWKMSRRGMKVDVARMKAIETSCNVAIKEGNEKISVLVGHPVNMMSRKQVAEMLYNELGLPIIKRGETGPSTDDKTLAALAIKARTPEQKAGCLLVRHIRKNRSLISKFTEIEYDADQRMRCHYKIAGTVTGRLSSSKFFPTGTGANLQNIPRDKRVRSVFVPDPGKVFFYNDLERAESLVVAKITGDPTMLKHHEAGADAHRLLASLLFEKPEDEVTPEERYMGKQTRHAGNYMEGWKTFMDNVNKLAEETGVALDARQAKFFINKYRALHPYLQVWWRHTAAELRKPRRTLYNLLGRPRQFFDRVDESLPTAVAYVPQSTVGDVLNVAIERIDRDEYLVNDLGCELLVQVHDAIGGQVPEEHAEEAMILMGKHMKVDLEVPQTGEIFSIPAELALGPSWGEVKVRKDLMALL